MKTVQWWQSTVLFGKPSGIVLFIASLPERQLCFVAIRETLALCVSLCWSRLQWLLLSFPQLVIFFADLYSSFVSHRLYFFSSKTTTTIMKEYLSVPTVISKPRKDALHKKTDILTYYRDLPHKSCCLYL